MLARHEEIRHQKQRAEKSVTVGFPAKSNKCSNTSHACMHAMKKSVATLEARHVGLCTCADRPAPNLVRSKVVRVSCRYVFRTYLAQTPLLPEVFVSAKDACRHIVIICRPAQKKKKKNRGCGILTITSDV